MVACWMGCASPGTLPADSDRRILALSDRAVAEAGTGDAAYARVPGHPHLRVDRFLAALGENISRNPTEDSKTADHEAPALDRPEPRAAWLEALRDMDREARGREIANLPPAAAKRLGMRLGVEPDRETLRAAVAAAGDRLLERNRREPAAVARIAERARAPSEYSLFLRTAGAYPVTVLPVAWITRRVNRRIAGWHREPETAPPLRGERRVFAPDAGQRVSPGEMARWFAPENRDPLGRPTLSEAEEAALFGHFAPVFAVDVAAGYDRPGRMVWNGPAPGVDPREPSVYTYRTHGFFRGETAVRLHYVLWFPARSGPVPAAYERGHLDGLTVRVNLDPAGRPFLVDIMNNCGCYHFFAPAPDRVAETISRPFRLDPFVPTTLPTDFPGRRLTIDVMSSWHQVYRISAPGRENGGTPYRLRPYAELESLPRSDGGRESLFSPRGIGKGTDRVEPFIFFPMGVPNVGAMRQRGRHAIAFVGRDHFDDPKLFDRHFRFR
jgi:hypothetical protein